MPSTNPFQTDPKLKEMVEGLDQLSSKDQWKGWKSTFLETYSQYLDQNGAKPASQAYQDFRKDSNALVKKIATMQTCLEQGVLSPQKTTVKGRRALTEACKGITDVVTKEIALVPSSTYDEKRLRYSKYHLGAVLVQDGFTALVGLEECEAAIRQAKEQLSSGGVANSQQLEDMEKYSVQLKRFKDIMADLGLFRVMLKSWEFEQPESVAGTILQQVSSYTPTVGSPGSPVKRRNKMGDKGPKLRLAPISPLHTQDDAPSVSSYETVESIGQESYLEDQQVSDSESSYETVVLKRASTKKIKQTQEVEVSDYVTDSSAEEEYLQKRKERRRQKRMDKARKKAQQAAAEKKEQKKKKQQQQQQQQQAATKQPQAAAPAPTAPVKTKKMTAAATAAPKKESPAKKKSGGLLNGLFGRKNKKKDKDGNMKDQDQDNDQDDEQDDDQQDPEDDEEETKKNKKNNNKKKKNKKTDDEAAKTQAPPPAEEIDPYAETKPLSHTMKSYYHNFSRDHTQISKDLKRDWKHKDSDRMRERRKERRRQELEKLRQAADESSSSSSEHEKCLKRVTKTVVVEQEIEIDTPEETERRKKLGKMKTIQVRKTRDVVNKRKVKKS